MKKLICFLLAVMMTVSLSIPVFAEESEEPQYGTIKVEYSDARGTIENLDVMVLNGYVYAHMASFCERLGYRWQQENGLVSIYAFAGLVGDQSPTLALHFRPGSTTLSYNPLCGIEIEYEAPTPFIENDRGIWVPLHYTLTLLGGSRNFAGDILVIQMPSANVLSVAAMIMNNEAGLSFDWVDDFGYSETATNVTDGAARIVTLFEGLLSFDGSAWTSFVDWNAFDKKFGKSLAALMCTYSSDELKDSIEEVEVMLDVFADDGALGSMLRTQEDLIDSDINAWEKICEEKLVQLKAGCGTLPQYNMAYQQYERATKKQDLFSAVGADEIISIQDGLAEATNVLEYAKWIGYGVTYLAEFQQRDDFQATVLKNYFATRRDTDELDDAAAKAIADYASSNLIDYTASKLFEEHALEFIVDKSGLDALMGVPANLLLLAWDIMSETIPFYSEGLDSVENREISNYAQQVQNDAYQNLNTLIASLRADTASLSPKDCVQLAEYCYVYLKSCYIARSFAIESLEGVSEETHKKLESKINAETDANHRIVKYLSILGQADLENSCLILGFLPKNNRELLEMYTDESIVDIVILGNQNQSPQLSQIKTYEKVGDLDALTNIKTFHYGEDGYLESIDDEELSTSGTLTNKGTVLIEMDSKGRLIKMEADENSDIHYAYAEYKYNDRDQLVSSTVYDGGGGTTYYFYDAADRLIKEEESMGDMGNCIAEYTYVDNMLAKKTITTQYFGFGDSKPFVEEILYKLDEKGRVVEENNTTRSWSTAYNYDHWPIVVSSTTYERGNTSSGFRYNDSAGHSIFTIELDDMRFFVGNDGRLIRITGSNNLIPYTYEFIYEQMTEATQEGDQPESYIYDTNEIAAMVKSYFAEDWKDGNLLVLLRSETDGIVRFSLKFDPDDPEEYPDGMSMPIAEIMVDMMTGEMFVDYESRTFLW